MSRYDRDTTYTIEEGAKGFAVVTYVSRYQFIAEASAVVDQAKQAATAIAKEHASVVGKKVKIDHDRTRISSGRNGLTGMTSATVRVEGEWE